MSSVVVNIAHKGLQCKGKDDLPAIRIMGFFPSVSHANNHVKKILKRKLVEEIGFYVVDAFSKFVIPSSTTCTPEYLSEKAKRLYESRVEENKQKKENFDRRIGKTMEKEEIEEDFKKLIKKKEKEEEEKENFFKNMEVDEEDDTFVYRDAEVRNQRYCAVGIINDPDKSLNESMLAIYAGFETEEICIRYIEDTLADDEENMHLYCVDMYQWLYPTLTDNRGLMSEIPQSYRHDELNNWINGKKKQDAMIKKIKDTAEAHKNSKKQSESVGDDETKE